MQGNHRDSTTNTVLLPNVIFQKVSSVFVILTQSSISPALGVAGCMDQKHAGLMGHPRAEEKQQSA